MKNTLLTTAAFAIALGMSGAALAGGKSDCAPGQNQDDLVFWYGESGGEPTGSPTPGGWVDTLGGALSGGFYGNTSNAGNSPSSSPPDHGVLPSESPGPQLHNVFGPGEDTSIGDAIQLACPS